MQKEIPILFSTPMVKAILEGRKTMTRRIVKPQPDDDGLWNHDKFPMSLDSDLSGWWGTVDDTGESKEFKCPYGWGGKPYLNSSILWVRESWNYSKPMTEIFSGNASSSQIVYKAGRIGLSYGETDGKIDLKKEIRTITHGFDVSIDNKWRPSIHLPKEASRIWLEVADVKVERLQSISKEDAIKEGMPHEWQKVGCVGAFLPDPRAEFALLWEKLNGEDSWEANPWVWVVSFKALSITGKPITNNQ